MDFWMMIHVLGAAQGMFMAAMLFLHPRGNQAANRFLGLLLLAFSLRLLEIVAFWTGFLFHVPHLFLTTFSFPYLFGVLFYLYTRQLILGRRRSGKGMWLHFIPFAVCAVSLVPFYSLDSGTKLLILENQVNGSAGGSNLPFSYLPFSLLKFPHVLVYLALSARLLKSFSSQVENSSRHHDRIRVKWLQRLTTGAGFLFAVWFLYGMARIFGLPHQQLVDYSLTSLMTIFIYSVGYFAFRLPEVFHDGILAADRPKYEGSTLTPEKAHQYLGALKNLMHTDQLYRNSGLKLQDLAARLNISVHLLSQIINEYENQSFFDFVNRYRIDDAKEKLRDPKYKQYNLLGIAYEVGFNNKASFNSFFKKFTGETPSEFKKRQNGK